MARSEPLPGVTVEVFIEENEIAPAGVGVELWSATMYSAMSLLVAQKDPS
jgi:hypothetical protein